MANLKEIAAGTLIGFSGNKTVATAKTDTSTNRVDICSTKQLYFNGERIGVTDNEQTFLENGISSSGMGMASHVVMSSTDSTNIKTYIDNKVGAAVAGAYKFKKSVASLVELFKETTNVGDVFNITSDFTISSGDNAGTYKAGTNVAVNTAFAGNGTEAMIDPLGGTTVDLSPYVTTSTLTTTLGNYYKKTDTYSKTEVNTKLNSYYTKDEVGSKLNDYALVAHLSESNLKDIVTTGSSILGHEGAYAKAAKVIANGGVVNVKGSNPGVDGYHLDGISETTARYTDDNNFRLSFVYNSKRYNIRRSSGEQIKVTTEDYKSSMQREIDSLKSNVEALKAQLLLA